MSTHGQRLNEDELRPVLEYILKENIRTTECAPDSVGTPVCIWGNHGIGKTQLVEEIAAANGWHFAYCAPGQFEEMGDFHGMPRIVQLPDGRSVTESAPPRWVPSVEGPGILLLDDINRADDRILRGIMQLLQNHEMGTWSLPSKWQIVATANPDNGNYSVTSMDEAMLTRMLHFTLSFDAKVWAAWATPRGIDPRGIAFVLSYPETVSGKRTTPRTLTQFFEKIAPIQNLKENLSLVASLGMACLDEPTVSAFVAFINDDLALLPDTLEILHARTPEQVSGWKEKLRALAKGKGGNLRVDRLSAVLARVLIHLAQPGFEPDDTIAQNLIALFKLEVLPKDLGIGQYPTLVGSASGGFKALLQRPDVAAALGSQFFDDLLSLRRSG
jgi:hypothetical protein